jgi:iron complex outermembrane receptor protein
MARQPHFTLSSIAAAVLAITTSHALAQSAPAAAPPPPTAASAAPGASSASPPPPPPPSAQLEAVTVTGRAAPAATVAGWGDIPLAKTPVQASVFTADQLHDLGVQRLSDLTRVDPAVSDAYNAEGYWDYLTVRGYVLDNQYNFRRDGLPIDAETSIPLDNKSRIEILKGTSGMQAGTSAPGGLVNYIVKRPLDGPLSTASLEWVQPGTVTAAVDLSRRFGVDNVFGVRVNAAAAHLDPWVRDLQGNRNLFALAADWRLAPGSLLEAEIETSRRSQPSQPGFSMLGDVVPPPGDPRINLNNQPWSLPVVLEATTASLRWQQKLTDDWRFVAHAMTQRLHSDDRLAYSFGCSKENNFDRYCSDGTFDYYDFQSDGERRISTALQLSLEGKATTGPFTHQLGFSVLQSSFHSRLRPQVDDTVPIGTGSVDGQTIVPSSALAALGTVPNTDLDERSTELSVRDAITLTDKLGAWLGVRYTHLRRQSTDTTGAVVALPYGQSFTTPWVALSYAFAPGQLVYASWGRGVESTVVPSLPVFDNSGAVFTTQSRQTEIGLKGASQAFEWNVAAFDIQRAQTNPVGNSIQLDGTAHHRGVEASGAWRQGPWTLRGGAQWLHARIEGSQDPTINGQQPTNVPQRTLKLQAGYDVASLPGLNLQAGLKYESSRMVLPDNSASIPGYTLADAGFRYDTKAAGAQWTWRAGIDNLFDKRAWRESPYEFSHAYLYPVAPRTLRISLQVGV